MAALEAVDAVVLFDEDTPLTLINAVRPDVLVKGSDYSEDQVVGAREVKSLGGHVALVEIVPGRSTSNIIGKLGG
jgi:D-beta-D-heptose 7-phosphate kinase/D-beta-D-heptose 1-phosphate adenosyltransferase